MQVNVYLLIVANGHPTCEGSHLQETLGDPGGDDATWIAKIVGVRDPDASRTPEGVILAGIVDFVCAGKPLRLGICFKLSTWHMRVTLSHSFVFVGASLVLEPPLMPRLFLV